LQQSLPVDHFTLIEAIPDSAGSGIANAAVLVESCDKKRSAAVKNRIEYVNPPGACPAQGLYSHATRVQSGTSYYVAGQLSVGSKGEVVGPGDFERQFHQVFANLGTVLKGLGCGFNDVVKFTTFLVHSQDIEKFMRARAALFPSLFAGALYPPNTLLVIDRLVKEDFLIEVEAVVSSAEG
jgi:enamine deaminase RidA (YjgF/YER057c/UK114 family)